ncbi:transposase [Streptomyces sp. 24-1644]|uniref:transposase n=1 Tax=Streptomyces sp. 24-1644 TaxID=3457315 RepID=UPI003FA7271A
MRRRRKLRLKQALLGRSRGGLTSKIHLAADRRCRPLAFVLTAGQAADSPQFIPVLEKVRVRLPVGRPRTRPGAVAGDKAYSSRGNRRYLRKRNIKAVIPEEGPGRKPQEEGLTRRPVHQPRRRPLQGTEHRRTPDQQAESLARHRHPLRQVARKLPRRPPPPSLHDLDRRPAQDHRVITTSHRP